MRARCPRCARPCEQFYTPMPGEWFACDNCERGDGVDSVRGIAVALGPVTFTREEADEASRERLGAWDAAVAANRRAIDGEADSAIASVHADDLWYTVCDPLLPANRLAVCPFGVGMGR